MTSAVLTRSNKGNKSIFQPVMQILLLNTHEERMAIIRHIVYTLPEKKKKIWFLVLISLLHPNSIQSHKGDCGFPTEAQSKGAGTSSIKALLCKGKQNIK